MLKYIFSIFILFGISYTDLISQPFQPCTGPGQNSCTCATAPKICSIVELNGYTFTMSSYQHPNDGPTPMCPGQFGVTVSNNPTWVAFIAYCTDFDLNLSYSSCTNSGGWRGLQAAIYSDCNNLPGSMVECATDYGMGYGCINNGVRNLTVSGLTLGGLYYLLVDGCGGSACTVTITVNSSSSCVDEIEDWPGDITGETQVCIGSTHQYCVDQPNGGIKYLWYIDNQANIVHAGSYDPSGITCADITWNTLGTYLLCVDAGNSCLPPFTSDPPPNCITVNVYDAEAGNITANPNPVCPNGVINISVTSNNTSTGISQYIVIADANGNIVKVTQGTSDTFTWPECGQFTAYSYNYVTALGTLPVLGDNISTIQSDCTANGECCELASVPLEFVDTSPPVITGLPPDITVNCFVNIPA
ncbi:MAG TPA: hypothetical protein PLO48_14050, partial [Saprospiraceae bacterium]|nr:hypothetical protein [Saprospiraceae bacterium]